VTHNAPVRHGARWTAAGTLFFASFAAAETTHTPAAAKDARIQIVARGEVVTRPRRASRHGRQYLEFEITISAFTVAPEQPPGGDRNAEVKLDTPVAVVHVLGCNAGELALAVGDKVQLSGEYVKGEKGDQVRFTHGSGGGKGCSLPEGHPDGYLQEIATPTPTPTPPHPADIVPDQPFVSTPDASEKPYSAILRLKAEGASEEKLLERIAAEPGKRYALTTRDLQKLQAAGVSQRVIEAMLRSGRGPVTPTRTPTP
jgi:hypothetical protein